MVVFEILNSAGIGGAAGGAVELGLIVIAFAAIYEAAKGFFKGLK